MQIREIEKLSRAELIAHIRFLNDQLEAVGAGGMTSIQNLLKDPVVVHNNMCRGIIAPITFDMLSHVLGEDAKREWVAANIDHKNGYKLVPIEPTSEQVCKIAFEIMGYDKNGVCRTDNPMWPECVEKANKAYKTMIDASPEPSK